MYTSYFIIVAFLIGILFGFKFDDIFCRDWEIVRVETANWEFKDRSNPIGKGLFTVLYSESRDKYKLKYSGCNPQSYFFVPGGISYKNHGLYKELIEYVYNLNKGNINY